MRTIFLVLTALLCCATSHAATITADAMFEFFFHGGDGGPIIDPPITGEGSFSMRENRWAAFSFDMFGHHWSLDDVDPIFCHPAACFPNEHGSDLEVMQIQFADEAGSGFFFWDFPQGIFTGGVDLGDICACGTSDDGSVSFQFLELSFRVNVPEPGSLTLLTLGLLGLGWIRRPAHRVGQARRPVFD